MIRVLENPLYYLENFHRVVDCIVERYSDLLNDEERVFIDQFIGLPQAARALFVRMVLRKGCLFRASKLVYVEIGDTHAAAMPLIAAGWLLHDPAVSLEELFDLLQKPEIGIAFALTGALKNARKAQQLDALRTQFPDSQPFSQWHADETEHLYHIVNKALCDRLRLMFFGNFRQDWSEFVLADLGVYQYEKVEFSAASRGFGTRQDIDAYLALQQCREDFDTFVDSGAGIEALDDVLHQLEHQLPDNAWLSSRREKLRFRIAQHVEKLQDWPAALTQYGACRYPGARARKIRVLEKDGQFSAAFELLCEATQAPESDAEQQLLLRMAPRLRRKLGHIKPAKAIPAPVTRLDVCLPLPQQDWHVEGVVRDHLAQDGSLVYYVENTLINSLFGLLCWPAIFKPIPGAFFHPFHRGPADLHSLDFRQRRREEFDACLGMLDSGAYRDVMLATHAAKAGIESPFVFWSVVDTALLTLALDCIPALHLKKWCERILADIATNRSGLPDLIQFWPLERRYQMIEVKGPGDRLQDNQKRWLDYCAEHDMPVSVCYLQWDQAA